MVAVVELVAGVFLLLGLATRVWAISLIVTMIVAVATAAGEDAEGIVDFLSLDEAFYVAGLTWLVVGGAGGLSLNHAVVRFVRRRNGADAPSSTGHARA